MAGRRLLDLVVSTISPTWCGRRVHRRLGNEHAERGVTVEDGDWRRLVVCSGASKLGLP